MQLNTAIFYDIENLIKGYDVSQSTLSDLSLREILSMITQTKQIGDIAIQRAYANWSDPRLSIMRGEINELGIEPIQVFGFSQYQKKNNADIQLAVDAIDIAHIRPSLEIFVIVSGDGGFTSLAKKLHEYGRKVLGASYKRSASHVFQAVCDEFVLIPDPEQDYTEENRGNNHSTEGASKQLPSPRVARLIKQIERTTSIEEEDQISKIKEIIKWFDKDSDSRREMKDDGIHLSVVKEALNYLIPDFQPIKWGFPKFVEFLQYVCQDTHLCAVRSAKEANDVRLAHREFIPNHFEILPDLNKREIHSEEAYRAILTKPGGIYLKLPSASDIQKVAKCIAERPLIKDGFGVGIEDATNRLYPGVNADSVKLAFLAFNAVGIFIREPEGTPLAEQQLTLREDLRSTDAVLAALRTTARCKIEEFLNEIDINVLDKIIPNGEYNSIDNIEPMDRGKFELVGEKTELNT